MDKVIPFNKGIHRQPSLGEAGELSECVNLIPVNGELVNVRGLEDTGSLSIQGILIATHKVDGGLNYIYLSGNTLKSRTYENVELTIGTLSGYKDVGIIGNTICVSTSTGVVYALWRGGRYIKFTQEDLTYKFNVEFGDTYRFKGIHDSVDPNLDGADKTRALFQGADTAVNKLIAERSEPTQWFKYISLGMAALKLYDGSYVSHSAIFTLDAPSKYHGVGVSVDGESFEVGGSLMAYNITVSLTKNYALIKDVVSSVDIFLSLPTGFFNLESSEEIVRTHFPKKGYDEIIKEIDVMQFFKSLSFNIDEFKEDSNGDYYITKIARRVYGTEQSLDLSEIQGVSYTGECVFPYNGRLSLGNVVTLTRSVNTPDMNQMAVGDKKIKKEVDEYGNVTEYFKGYYDMLADKPRDYKGSYEADTVIEVDISGDSGDHMRTYRYKGKMEYPFPPIISYPNANAKQMRIYVDSPNRNSTILACAIITLRPLNLSNMAVAVNIVESETEASSHLMYLQPYTMKYTSTNEPSLIKDVLIPPNKAIEWKSLSRSEWDAVRSLPSVNPELREGNTFVYSPYGNPFSLNTISNIRVGNGEIIGVSTSAKALSQGQFGQFPLYAFCTDGVYALEVASDGSFSATNPISRDVCNNPDSITQIDGAVVFTTDQGLKMIQGSDVVLLSGGLEGHNVNERDYFGEGFFTSFGDGYEAYDSMVVQEIRDFRVILKTCRIAYDYTNQLLRIFPKREDGVGDTVPYKYYVYSFETSEFSSVVGDEFAEKDEEEKMLYKEVSAVIADYPSSIVQIGDKLYRPMETERDGVQRGLLLTRPLAFDSPFAPKKLHDLRLQYSNFTGESKCKVILYASNDGKKWTMLKSLRGGSYKYFRIAVVTKLSDADALTGTIVRYELERTNKLR